MKTFLVPVTFFPVTLTPVSETLASLALVSQLDFSIIILLLWVATTFQLEAFYGYWLTIYRYSDFPGFMSKLSLIWPWQENVSLILVAHQVAQLMALISNKVRMWHVNHALHDAQKACTLTKVRTAPKNLLQMLFKSLSSFSNSFIPSIH